MNRFLGALATAGLTTMANSIYNQSRFEYLWLEQGIGNGIPRP
jgi:hypothetical protein